MLPRVYASWWINGYRYFLHLGVYFFFFNVFTYWPCWVFVSPAGASRGYSLVVVRGLFWSAGLGM